MNLFLIFAYAAMIPVTTLLISKFCSWGQSKSDTLVLSFLWPLFLLLFISWNFGNLVDHLEDRIFHKRSGVKC